MAQTVLHRAPLFHWKMKIDLQNDSKMFFPFNFSNEPDERHPVELALHHRLQWRDRHEGLA